MRFPARMREWTPQASTPKAVTAHGFLFPHAHASPGDPATPFMHTLVHTPRGLTSFSEQRAPEVLSESMSDTAVFYGASLGVNLYNF